MNLTNIFLNQLARLPDGQLVRLERIYRDGYAMVRRIDGEWKGEIAVCAIASLSTNSVPETDLATNKSTR